MAPTPDRPRPAPGASRDGISRRSFIGGASLAALLTACSPGSGRQSSSSGGRQVTVSHKYGSTTVPAAPKRVVTVGLTEQDYVLALGVVPVGVREWFGGHPGALWPWARDEMDKISQAGKTRLPTVLPTNELNFEQIVTLRPDLILGVNSGLTRNEYDTLAKIAPTVAQPREHADYGAPWQTITRVTGQALGQPKSAEKLLAGVERRFDRVRAAHPEFHGATGMLATSIAGSAYIYAEGPAPEFLRSLGLELPSGAAKQFSGKNRAPVELSKERLSLLEADVLVMGLYGDRATSVPSTPLYQKLDVAREGRDVLLPEMSRANGALSFGSVLSLPVALDLVVPKLAAAIDGDPATRVPSSS